MNDIVYFVAYMAEWIRNRNFGVDGMFFATHYLTGSILVVICKLTFIAGIGKILSKKIYQFMGKVLMENPNKLFILSFQLLFILLRNTYFSYFAAV